MPKPDRTRPRADGARILREYLDNPHVSRGKAVDSQSVPDFCEEHGLDRINVQRVLTGERQKVSVDLAYAIEKATGGVVTWDMWLQKTRRIDRQRRRPTAHAATRAA